LFYRQKRAILIFEINAGTAQQLYEEHPPEILPQRASQMLVRKNIHDRFHNGIHRNRNLFGLPPFLYRESKIGERDGPRRQILEKNRQKRHFREKSSKVISHLAVRNGMFCQVK